MFRARDRDGVSFSPRARPRARVRVMIRVTIRAR